MTDPDTAVRDRIIAKALAYAIAFIDSLPPEKQLAPERRTMRALLRAYAGLAAEQSSGTATSANILDALAHDVELRSGRGAFPQMPAAVCAWPAAAR